MQSHYAKRIFSYAKNQERECVSDGPRLSVPGG